jgi:DNA-binding response OmpR family regulator
MNDSIKKILVVEDDDDLRKILVSGLSVFNYQILEAGDGEQAVEKLVDSKPDLVLLDLLLPKLDGFKVLERLRGYPDKSVSETKVMILSNLWSDKDILRAKALKVDEYYVKANSNMEDVFSKARAMLSGAPAVK